MHFELLQRNRFACDVRLGLKTTSWAFSQLPWNIFCLSDDRRITFKLHLHHNNRTLTESQQYGIGLTQSDLVWAITNAEPNKYPNTPVKVCIVDTGYDGNHQDLPKSGITTTQTGYGNALEDGDGHGTHVSGVVGAIGNNDRGIVGGKSYTFFCL